MALHTAPSPPRPPSTPFPKSHQGKQEMQSEIKGGSRTILLVPFSLFLSRVDMQREKTDLLLRPPQTEG